MTENKDTEPLSDAVSTHRHAALMEAVLDGIRRGLTDKSLAYSHRCILGHIVGLFLESPGGIETYFRELEPVKIANHLGLAIQTVHNGLSKLRSGGYIVSEMVAPHCVVFTVTPHIDLDVVRAEIERFCDALDTKSVTHGRVTPYTHGRVHTHGRVTALTSGRVTTSGQVTALTSGRVSAAAENQEVSSKNRGVTSGRVNHYYNGIYNGDGRSKPTNPSPGTVLLLIVAIASETSFAPASSYPRRSLRRSRAAPPRSGQRPCSTRSAASSVAASTRRRSASRCARPSRWPARMLAIASLPLPRCSRAAFGSFSARMAKCSSMSRASGRTALRRRSTSIATSPSRLPIRR
jgi:hypothetical protein